MPIKNTFSIVDTLSTVAVTSSSATQNATAAVYTVSSHPFQTNQYISISGMSPAGYNGIHKITAQNATSITVLNSTNSAITVTSGLLSSYVVVNDSKINLYGAAPMDFRKVESFTRTAQAAGTPGASTATGATSAGTQNIVLSQYVKSLGKVVSVTLQYNSATAPANTAAPDAWKQQYDALPTKYGFNIASVTSSAGTFTVTAAAPDNYVFLQSVGTVAVTVNNASTSPVARVGYGADLLQEGFTGVTSTNYYLRYEWVFGSVDPKGTAGANDYQVSKHTALINAGGSSLSGSYTILDTDVQNQMKAIAVSSSSIEGIALLS